MAEYREIRLLSAMLTRTLNSYQGYKESKVPKTFTLNAGHVYFFFNKGKYLHNRFLELKQELLGRGFNVVLDFPRDLWPDELYNDWEPNPEDLEVVRERIASKISLKPWWYRYSG